MPPKRVTQKDIAAVVGVHDATVSLALRNHPSIPEETRRRIRLCAEELGYRPDPMLSALSSYRSALRPHGFQGTLAWLTHDPDPQYNWSGIPHYRDYYIGANARAEECGYQLEPFEVRGISMARIASILRTRGIDGILICPQPTPNAGIDLPWEHYSAVTFGYTLTNPQLHMVTSAHFSAAAETVRELLNLGYKRIGFCLSSSHDTRVMHNFLGGYLMEMKLAGLEPPELHDETGPLEDLKRWIERNQLDAVVSGGFGGLDRFLQMGISIPEKLGVGCPTLGNPKSRFAGIVEDNIQIGRVGMDFVVAMAQRGERGIPVSAQHILVRGKWHVGESVRARQVVG